MAGVRCRGFGRVHKVPHLLLPPWNLLGASLELRSQREGRAVRGVDLGQLCNHCLLGSSVALGGGGGGMLCDVIPLQSIENNTAPKINYTYLVFQIVDDFVQ